MRIRDPEEALDSSKIWPIVDFLRFVLYAIRHSTEYFKIQ